MLNTCRLKKRKITLVLTTLSCLFLIKIVLFENKQTLSDNFNEIYELLEYGDVQSLYCKLPKLELKGHTNHEKLNKCKYDFDWGYTKNGKWFLSNQTKSLYTFIKCKYRKIIRLDDFNLKESDYAELFDGDSINSELFEVSCKAKSRSGGTKNYENLHAQILPKNVPYVKHESSCKPLNVLMICYDSVSRISWLKRMNKSTQFMFEQMGYELLEGFNILGDGTPAALIPILTGFIEEELPSTLKNDPYGKYVDEVYPFIFNDLTKLGYVNYFNEDWPHVGTFYYRMRGMKHEFVTHYLRPYQLRLWNRSKFSYFMRNDLCLGAKTRHKKSIELLQEFIDLYRKKTNYFAFMHYSENSHDGNNRLHLSDQDLYDFLSENYHKNVFNDTMILIFGDHGDRFNTERQSRQGYLEERLPFLSIYIPSEHKKNLALNRRKLISSFDIHETLREITCLNYNNISRQSESKRIRSLSLLDDIPFNRSCKDIGISDHFCVCNELIELNSSSFFGRLAAEYSIKYINTLIETHEQCIRLDLDQITQVQLIKRKREIPQMMIKFSTQPNNAIYEASVLLKSTKPLQFHINSISDISRLNKYGNQAWCIYDISLIQSLIDIRKFCFCKNKIS